jgi:zinc/manganese transport system ATP-binding protein
MIIANNVSLGYPNRLIASGISFTIQQGEFIGIFGANGSGKTTFLRTLLGLQPPRSGQLTILGEKPRHGNHRMGYMPQAQRRESTLNLTGRTLMMAAIKSTQFGIPLLSKKDLNSVQQVLFLVEATDFADRPLCELSGGERQRIYLAQALLGNPSILLLDEPLAGLDPKYQEMFIHLLSNVQKKLQATVLFTAHDPNPLLKIMDRVLYFANHKVMIGSTQEVITSEKLSLLYETPIDVIHYKERLIVLGENRSEEGHHD